MSGGGPSGGGRIYGQHGERHQPWGSDPSVPGVWIYVGVDPRVPFVTGSNASPSVDIPNPVPMRFRIVIGRPNECDYAGWGATVVGPVVTPGGNPTATTVIAYTDHQLEIQGDVTGVSPGDTVFVLPLEFQLDHDVPFHSHDDIGAYVPCRLLSTGEFLYGMP